MEYSKEQKAAKEQISEIFIKCWEDEDFKQELIANPSQVFEKFKGSSLNIPKGVRLIVNDQSNVNEYHFNIPSRPDFDNMELTERQLELVAGGGTILGDWLAEKAKDYLDWYYS